MAGHFITNRGKLRLLQGKWDDTGGTTIKVGLLNYAAIPASIDTAGEVADLNTVADLLAAAGVAEMTASGYARQTISRTVASEDDTNDRVNMDASDVTFTGVAAGQNAGAAFYYIDGASDALRDLLSVDEFTTIIPTNGSNLSLPIADLYRAS